MFSKKTIDAIEYYVYCLVDPRNDEIFYIGKGTGNRVFAHVNDALGKKEDKKVMDSEKMELIREIDSEGLKVNHYIIRYGLSAEIALEVEAALIDCLGLDNLVNEMKGHNCERGKISCEELEIKFGAEEAVIEDNVLVIKINQLYRREMNEKEIYEATRKYWRLNKANAEKTKYVLSIANGIIRGVFEPTSWYEEEWPNKQGQKVKKVAFEGKTAPQTICEKYLYKTVNSYAVTQGQNPAVYIFGANDISEEEKRAVEEDMIEEEKTVESESSDNEVTEIDEEVITIKINKKYREGMSEEELYDATRYCWNLSLEKAKKAQYVFAIANGEIKEIYEELEWYEVEELKRIAFTGVVANQQIREKYIGRTVRGLYRQGEANPCKYFYSK